MLKLLIADASEEFRTALEEELRGRYQIRMCAEGKQTLEEMRSFAPDVMVLDLMLPGLDGITLLQRAGVAGIRPAILALTRIPSDYVVRTAAQLGVDYLMMKPCDIRAAVERLADLTREHPKASDDQAAVDRMMLMLGLPTKRRGYLCLREAILEMLREPSQQMTKTLYPTVAARCNGNAKQVEHAIREVIEDGWNNRDQQLWRQLFPPNARGQEKRPTNAAFITTLVHRIRTGWKPDR